MMNKLENKMIIQINKEIMSLCEEYKRYGRSDWYRMQNYRICGMIDMLILVTDKEYYFDDTGLHERLT